MYSVSKKFIFPAIAVIVIAAVYAFNNPKVNFKADKAEGIQFHRGGWKDALQAAKKENRLIFLDIYATWCGPCKKLKKNTFSSKEAGVFYNAKFINVTLDGEQGDGAILARQYNISGYPSLLFIDATGKLITLAGGYHNPGELLELGKSVSK